MILFTKSGTWEIYKGIDEELNPYCGLSKKMEERLREWTKSAENGSWDDGHWKIKVLYPRRNGGFSYDDNCNSTK